jgi:hypothetical protein
MTTVLSLLLLCGAMVFRYSFDGMILPNHFRKRMVRVVSKEWPSYKLFKNGNDLFAFCGLVEEIIGAVAARLFLVSAVAVVC